MTRKQNDQAAEAPQLSRRQFLAGFGASAAVGAFTLPQQVKESLLDQVTAGRARMAATRPDRFSRMFPDLPAFAPANQAVLEALLDMGRLGGILDAHDPIELSAIELIVDERATAGNPDNFAHTSGQTFLGQFLDHDMTFDVSSRLGVPKAPETAPNARTPGLDLDSVYGGGPSASAVLYDPSDRAKLLVESGGRYEDVPRAADGRAIIADPRNDQNMIISGMLAAFLLFHNRVVDHLRAQGVSEADIFATAQRTVRWHYQWIILRDFLPTTIGQGPLASLLRKGRRFYRPAPGEQFIPVEFQGAAYRFGHSQVRPSYRVNFTGVEGEALFLKMFVPEAEIGNPADPEDLRGGCRAERRYIGWPAFFKLSPEDEGGLIRIVGTNKRIDTKIATTLLQLPVSTIAGPELSMISLAQRDLVRHLTWSLPAGQTIAKAMGVPVLGADHFSELRIYGLGLDAQTPLWYYVLKEAEVLMDGARLGPLGALIVGEVIIGLLELDPNSFLATNPSWRPTLPRRDGSIGDFLMPDLLAFAGVAGVR